MQQLDLDLDDVDNIRIEINKIRNSLQKNQSELMGLESKLRVVCKHPLESIVLPPRGSTNFTHSTCNVCGKQLDRFGRSIR